jgi:urea transport system permease protein
MKFIQALLLCVFAFSGNVSANTDPSDLHNGKVDSQISQVESLSALLNQLPKSSYKEKDAILKKMASLDDKSTLGLFQNLFKGQLFYIKKTKQVVYRQLLDSKKFLAVDAINGQELGEFKKRKLKKIGINNSLRRTLKTLISELQITSIDDDIREHASLELLKNADTSTIHIIESALAVEKEESIKSILIIAQAIVGLHSNVSSERFAALTALDGSLYQESRNALSQFITRYEAHPEAFEIKELTLAQTTLNDINEMMKLNSVLENVYFGIALGAVLLLAAIGLAITFGVMGVINMAHGEMIMLGAYTTFVIQQLMPNNIGMSLVVAIPAAFLVSGIVGVLIERLVIRHLYGRTLETLLATFGISLILQQAVRSLFGPLNQDVVTPDWMAGSFMVNDGLALTYNRLYIIIFSLLVLGALALVLKRTLFGLQMRAVTMNRPMASSMGIKTGWVDALTFGLGSGIAGIAGVALSQLTNVGPNLGQAYIIDSFMVVVFGGVGNLWGTLVGAMSLGVANKMIEPMAGAVLAKIIVLVAIILFIQKRPRGLFALKGRAVED